MKLINFLGLNCYHNCMVSIAHHVGVDYCAAFSTLWSELSFRYETYREVYLSERLIENLARLGLELDMALCFFPEEAEARFAAIEDGQPVIVGMDAFSIPWNPFYETFHGPHYFIAEKAAAEALRCFDPTYDRGGEWISRESIVAHAFDISHMRPVAGRGIEADLAEEAAAILQTHHDARESILAQVQEGGERDALTRLAKYIDALIGNRYLFRHYLTERNLVPGGGHSLLTRAFFSQWAAVKNGLYKASIKEDNRTILEEVRRCFDGVMENELAIARAMQSGL